MVITAIVIPCVLLLGPDDPPEISTLAPPVTGMGKVLILNNFKLQEI